ncbi:carbohydrate kinase family protein [Candidatus Saccharibacteria bacterium]|nr:MAG: carbohydrate kinase family protein [Candidatus Saccharibacteria bacterium]
MSKYLQQLLGADEPMFSTTLRQLEKMTGHKATDVAYIADMTARAHQVMRRMGLDVADTTEHELYRALAAHAHNQTLFIATDDVGIIIHGQAVSFNYEDVQENIHRPFAERMTEHMKCQIKYGLTSRYVAADGDDEVAIEELIAQAGLSVCDMSDYHEHKQTNVKQKTRPPRLLFIGDIFTDAFIKLSPKVARVDKDDQGRSWISIPFGGRPPYEEVEIVQSVGPAPNAAVSCARLGLDVSLMSWLGDDKPGGDSLAYLSKQQVNTQLVSQKKQAKSNYYYVLRLGAERTILTKDEDYSYVWQEPHMVPDWIYLASISGESWGLHEALDNYLGQHPDIKFVIQPGTFHFEWGVKKMAQLYRHAYMVILNREEAVMLTGKSHESIPELAAALHELGPLYVVITDGPSGSYASFDGKLLKMPNYPDPAPPYDRTGAGDAFASTVVAAMALGEGFETALTWAPINSMSVVQKLGAQAGLLSKATIEEYIKKAPKWYKLEEIK